MKKKNASEKNDSFETSLTELEEIVYRMESGKNNLDSLIADYEKGVQLIGNCHRHLNQAEQRIAFVRQMNENGKFLVEDVNQNDLKTELKAEQKNE